MKGFTQIQDVMLDPFYWITLGFMGDDLNQGYLMSKNDASLDFDSVISIIEGYEAQLKAEVD